uniref:Uncharacterized protein n=1 Tax=Oryza punctata TaxID=4537 RepID=A0A0E0K6S0_ORYPU
MAQNKTIAVALLLATLVAVVAAEGATLEKDFFRPYCAKDCNKKEQKDPIDNKRCVDICMILNKQILGAFEGEKDPTMEKFSTVCNEGCSKEFKEDPATNKRCVDSCIAEAKEINGVLAKGDASGAPARE